MRSFKIIIIAAAALAAAASCTKTARIEGTVEGSPETDIVLKQLDVNVFNVLDTVKTDKNGKFSYKVEVEKNQPEFIYIFSGESRLASVVALPGDKIKISADREGSYSVEGSEESELLKEVESSFAGFLKELSGIMAPFDNGENLSNAEVDAINRAVSKKYVEYYRSSMKFLLSHPYSIVTVPLCFQKVNPSLPVFNQITDAISFRNVCDSLTTVYPESRYVKALEKETLRRESIMKLNLNIKEAPKTDFPELNLPSMTGEKVALSSLDSKAVLLYFWTSDDAAEKLLNLEVVKPVYEELQGKGLEVYAVDVTTSKADWAATVRNQNLPWTNVCDGLGTSSPALVSYNVGKVPTAFLLYGGKIEVADLSSKERLSSFIKARLK